MPQPSKPQLAIYAALAVAVLLIGARFLRAGDGTGATGGGGGESVSAAARPGAGATGSSGAGSDGSASSAPADGESAPAGGSLVVDVKGAVRRPGVYHLPAGARALDAVRRAGGLAHRADRVGVNLAARVVDGGEIVVPARGAPGAANGGGATAGGAAAPGGKGAGAAPLALDLNTATVEQLQQLDGVGPATAAKIAAYRTEHGGISSIDELDEVSGIGPAKLAAIRTQLGR